MKDFLKQVIVPTILSTIFVIAIGVTHAIWEAHTYEKARPPSLEEQMKSVVVITTDESYCSGWVLKGSHQVVTAAHCAPSDDTSVVNVNFGDGKQHPFHVEHKGDSSEQAGPDLMTLTTSDPTVPWPAGMAVCTFKPYYGEALTMFGGPLGYSWTASFGNVSNPTVDFKDNPRLDMSDVPEFAKHFIQYQGEMWPGNSGGPVTDDQFGCVMGISELIAVASPQVGFPDGIKMLTPATELYMLKGM